MSTQRVPFFQPEIGEEEIASVVETLRSGWLTTGPRTKEFERQFAARLGVPHAIAVNSATAALHLAIDALGIGPGDEVLVPTMTFTATAEVVVHRGARPVLVDCQGDTLNIDPERLAQAITPLTKAIIPVHYGGQPCDMDAIGALARQHGIPVIEDAAHALPAAYRGRPVGTISEVTCFSFYANKTITTGEGGMITTANSELAERMTVRSLHGMSKDAWKRFSAEGSWYYEVIYPGYKYNLTDIASSLGIHQLAKCDTFWEGRQRCALGYQDRLGDLEEIVLPRAAPHVQHSWHLYVIQIRPERLRISRNELIQQLGAAGIGTSVHYVPLHMHPWYRDTYGLQPDDFPMAKAAYERIISLPIFPRMTDDQVDYVCATLRRLIAEHRR